MPAPTFVTSASSIFSTNANPKTVSVAVQGGDLLVACAISADSTGVLSTPTNDGTALTWTARQTSALASNVGMGMWTAVADTTRTIVVSLVETGAPAFQYGLNVSVWRLAAYGTSAKANGGGVPTQTFSTTAPNSAIISIIGDWAAVPGTPDWKTAGNGVANTLFELAGDSATYAAHGAWYADTGPGNNRTLGLQTTPAGETYTIMALSIAGTAALLEQYSYRFRNDDGSETTATWKAAENTSVTLAPSTTARLRIGVNATGDPASKQFKLQYRKVGAASWRDADTFI